MVFFDAEANFEACAVRGIEVHMCPTEREVVRGSFGRHARKTFDPRSYRLRKVGEKVFANAYGLFEPVRYSRRHWSKYLRLMALAYNCKMLCRTLIRSSLFLPIRLKKARGV